MSKSSEWMAFVEAIQNKEQNRPKWAATLGGEPWATLTDHGTVRMGNMELNGEAAQSLARWLFATFGDETP